VTHAAQIDEDSLTRVVALFYERVRQDPELGPIFNETVDDWPLHLEKLVAFWSSVMLTSGRYKGSPMAAHLKHKARITPAMFDRCLALGGTPTTEIMAPAAAPAMQAKAAPIAESLQLAPSFRPADPPGPAPP